MSLARARWEKPEGSVCFAFAPVIFAMGENIPNSKTFERENGILDLSHLMVRLKD